MTKLKQQLATSHSQLWFEETGKCNQTMLTALLIQSNLMYEQLNKQLAALHR